MPWSSLTWLRGVDVCKADIKSTLVSAHNLYNLCRPQHESMPSFNDWFILCNILRKPWIVGLHWYILRLSHHTQVLYLCLKANARSVFLGPEFTGNLTSWSPKNVTQQCSLTHVEEQYKQRHQNKIQEMRSWKLQGSNRLRLTKQLQTRSRESWWWGKQKSVFGSVKLLWRRWCDTDNIFLVVAKAAQGPLIAFKCTADNCVRNRPKVCWCMSTIVTQTQSDIIA